MRKLLGSALVATALVAVPAVAAAQGMAHSAAKHEFGIDVAFAYIIPDDPFEAFFGVQGPVDLRFGFISGQKLTVEPRISLEFISDDQTGDANYDFGLGLNLTYGMSPQGNKGGLYLTGGAAIELFDNGGGNSGSVISLNAGLGTRAAYGSGAFRPEAFFRYDLENTDLGIPNIMSFGVRLGLSLWH
jgi:hypothetical protein